MKQTRIVIIDDHTLVRTGLTELIGHEPDLTVCGEAADAPTGLQLVRDEKPDLVIIDIMLKGGSGLELIKQIKALDPSIKMLVSSMHDEVIYAERVLAAGALGYVSKEEPAETLLEAMRKVLSGRIALSQRMADRLLRRVGHARQPSDSPLESLSDRELEVLGLIGQGLTTRQIADKLHLSVKTIDTHRENIKNKLNLDTANELVRYAVTWMLSLPAESSEPSS